MHRSRCGVSSACRVVGCLDGKDIRQVQQVSAGFRGARVDCVSSFLTDNRTSCLAFDFAIYLRVSRSSRVHTSTNGTRIRGAGRSACLLMWRSRKEYCPSSRDPTSCSSLPHIAVVMTHSFSIAQRYLSWLPVLVVWRGTPSTTQRQNVLLLQSHDVSFKTKPFILYDRWIKTRLSDFAQIAPFDQASHR